MLYLRSLLYSLQWVGSKALRFFPQTAFCGVWRDGAGYGENSLGLKTRFFLANHGPVRKFFTFLLAMAGNWLIFVYFGKEFVLSMRICMFWRGETGLREENFDFFLANPTPTRISGEILATVHQLWARYLEGDNISTKIGSGRVEIEIGEASPTF